MRTEIRALACVAAIVCSGLTGCVLGVPGVHDMNIVAVETVNESAGMLQEPFLKVTFSSRRNLFQYRQDYRWLVRGEFYRCDNGTLKEPPLSSMGTKWRNLDVYSATPDEYARIKDELKESETHLYHAYLRLRNDRIERNPEIQLALYDLWEDPQDVCYQLSGGGLWGHFHSNIVPIPKEMIVSAFERARERADIRPAK